MRFLRRFSPLAPWKLLRTLDEVRELPALRTKVQRGLEETKRLQKQIRDERKELAVLSTRVQQFEAVYKSDTRAARSPDRALKRIGDARVAAQLRAVVAAAPLESDPCPHIVLDDLFPDDAYDVLVAAIPPPMFFEHLSVERQDLKVPLQFAPRHHREVWQAFHTHIVMNALVAALFEKFRTDLDVLARTHWPGFVDSMADAGLNLHPVMSRIMRRRPGYEIKPHRDPRWAFLTCILYLTQRDDPQVYGTQLCRLQQEEEGSPLTCPVLGPRGQCRGGARGARTAEQRGGLSQLDGRPPRLDSIRCPTRDRPVYLPDAARTGTRRPCRAERAPAGGTRAAAGPEGPGVQVLAVPSRAAPA